jgi:hypothetical protein
MDAARRMREGGLLGLRILVLSILVLSMNVVFRALDAGFHHGGMDEK